MRAACKWLGRKGGAGIEVGWPFADYVGTRYPSETACRWGRREGLVRMYCGVMNKKARVERIHTH